MSKTERALDGDAAALDELEDFVASEAEAADRAIDELIDDAVEAGNGSENGSDGATRSEVSGANGGNGSGGLDMSELAPFDAPDSELDASEIEAVDEGDDGEDAFETGEIETPDVADVAEVTDAVEVGEVDGTDAGVELDTSDEVEEEPFSLVHLESLIETEDGVVDDEVEYELPEIVPATLDPPDPSDSVEAPEEARTVDDADERAELDGLDVLDTVDDAEPAGEVDGARPAVVAAALAEPVARESEVSDDILEELRRADIDGPIVEFAPQDDTTSARRRPKRRPDYDPAPVPIPARPPRILGRKPRVRKVTRVVRHVDPWSVFKIAVIANLVLYVILLTAGVLLWNVAYATGTIDNVERFFESFGWSSFEFNGGEIYHASWIIGLFGVIGLTGLAVLAATLFNLITDIVGGMRFTVLEEEVVETRTSPMRRFVVRRPEPEVPAVIRDSSGAMIREAVVDDSGAIER